MGLTAKPRQSAQNHINGLGRAKSTRDSTAVVPFDQLSLVGYFRLAGLAIFGKMPMRRTPRINSLQLVLEKRAALGYGRRSQCKLHSLDRPISRLSTLGAAIAALP